MKKLIIALVGVAALCGCDGTKNEPSDKPHRVMYADDIHGLSKVKIEGHDYMFFNYDRAAGICHSASCPCHTNKVEDEASK